MIPVGPRIAPSILSADFAEIHTALDQIGQSGAELIHCDVMDGRFVPNLTFGPKMIADIRKRTAMKLDVHLMIDQPELSFRQYLEAGADLLTFHVEACVHAHRLLKAIQAAGVQGGISLVPSTPVQALEELLFDADLVLVMSINPGFGGQEMLPRSLDRIRALKEFREQHGLSYAISVDGGVNPQTAPAFRAAGVDILVAGSAFFGAADKPALVRKLKGMESC